MKCPYKHCESKDILNLFVADGTKFIGNFYGTVRTTYCKCIGCGRYFKYISYFSPLVSTEKREAMTAEIKSMEEDVCERASSWV